MIETWMKLFSTLDKDFFKNGIMIHYTVIILNLFLLFYILYRYFRVIFYGYYKKIYRKGYFKFDNNSILVFLDYLLIDLFLVPILAIYCSYFVVGEEQYLKVLSLLVLCMFIFSVLLRNSLNFESRENVLKLK